MPSSGDIQIVTMYEELGFSPEEIAEDLDYDIVAVKSSLISHSKKYASLFTTKDVLTPEQAEANKELFTDDDMRVAANVMKDLATGAEAENVKFRAAEFIINERKGRNDIKALKETQVNIVMFNEQIARAKAVQEKMRAMYNGAIDVEQKPKQLEQQAA